MVIKLMNSWIQVRKEELSKPKSSLILMETKADKVGVCVGRVVNLPSKLMFEKIRKTDEGFEPVSTSRMVDPSVMGLSVNCRIVFRNYLSGMHELSDGTFLIHWQDILTVVPEDAEISNL
jgi:hypothetical protein